MPTVPPASGPRPQTPERPEYYECQNCYYRTLQREHVHIVNRMEFNPAFGNFVPDPRAFCCSCFRQVSGDCDESESYEDWL